MNNVILQFPNDLHKFDKSISRKNKAGEQKYVCTECGIVGWLKDDADTILIKKGNKAAIENCSNAGAGNMTQSTMINPDVWKYVRLLKEIKYGDDDKVLEKGSELQIIECPVSHKKDHNMKTWIKYGSDSMFLYDSEREFIDAPKEKEPEVIVEIDKEDLPEKIKEIAKDLPDEVVANALVEAIDERFSEPSPMKEQNVSVSIDDIINIIKNFEIKITFNYKTEEEKC